MGFYQYVQSSSLKLPVTIITMFTEPCEAGKRLDQSTGCQDCPADHWSAAANTANTCTACPAGKEVGVGLGKQESDCTWSKLIKVVTTIEND